MNAQIEIPPFPPLKWKGYAWEGEIRLPSWQGYRGRRGALAAVRHTGPLDSPAELTVEAEKAAPPTPEQVAAFRHLLDNEAAVAAAVGKALLDYYADERAAVPRIDEAAALPEITDPADLRPLLGLATLNVLALARDGMACIGFEFGCVRDDEHGAGVMTHRGRVIAVRRADRSFVEWMGREGLGES